MKRFAYNLLISVDQLLNTLLLGHPDETVSSRLGRSIGKERYKWVKWFRISVDTTFKFLAKEEDHCKNAIMPLEQQNFRTVVDYEIWDWNEH